MTKPESDLQSRWDLLFTETIINDGFNFRSSKELENLAASLADENVRTAILATALHPDPYLYCFSLDTPDRNRAIIENTVFRPPREENINIVMQALEQVRYAAVYTPYVHYVRDLKDQLATYSSR